LIVKKRKKYTLSELALQQRREAAKKPKREMKYNFNTCNKCFYFELVKAEYDVVIVKKKIRMTD